MQQQFELKFPSTWLILQVGAANVSVFNELAIGCYECLFMRTAKHWSGCVDVKAGLSLGSMFEFGYAFNFEKVRGAYCIWLVCWCVCVCVCVCVTLFVLTITFEP